MPAKRKRKERSIGPILKSLARTLAVVLLLSMIVIIVGYIALWLIVYFGAYCSDPVYIDGLPPIC